MQLRRDRTVTLPLNCNRARGTWTGEAASDGVSGRPPVAVSGAILPVERLMRQRGVDVDGSDFIETITGYYTKDSRLYSMPSNVSTPKLCRNREAFRKAGLDRPPATWPEEEAVSQLPLCCGAARCGFTTGGSPSWGLLENAFPWHDQPNATNQNGYTSWLACEHPNPRQRGTVCTKKTMPCMTFT